jgi:hypothetical protein
MHALLISLLLAASTQGPVNVPLWLGERQVVTLEFARPVARLAVSDADLVALEPAGTRLKVTAQRAGRGHVEVIFDDGLVTTYEVVVVPAKKASPPADAAAAGELVLSLGEERRVASPGLERVLYEENGAVKVRSEPGAALISAVNPGKASVLLIDSAGKRTSLTVKVKP